MSKFKDRVFYHLFLIVLSVFMSLTTVVLATIPLFLLRLSAGRGLYFFYSLALCAALLMGQNITFIVPIACSILLVAIYEEARLLTCSVFQAGLASLLSVSGLFGLGLSLFIQTKGLNLQTFLTDKVNLLMSSVKEMNPDLVIQSDKIILQLPSAIIMIFMISLWLGLVGRSFVLRRYKSLKDYNDEAELKVAKKFNGSQFQLPGNIIWLAIPVLALAFVDFQNESLSILGSNFLNIFIVLYFFHGLSLISYFFKANEISVFWQWFWYIILVLQMFLLVSSVGFADYWMDFRSKIRKHLAKAREGRLK